MMDTCIVLVFLKAGSDSTLCFCDHVHWHTIDFPSLSLVLFSHFLSFFTGRVHVYELITLFL